MKLIPTYWRIAPLLAATFLISACTSKPAPVVFSVAAPAPQKAHIFQAPKIFMKRVTAYEPPMPDEPIEDMVTRISAAQMKNSEKRILTASKKIAEETLVESEDYIRTLAKQIVVGDDDLVRQAIAKIAKQTVVDSDEDLDEAIRRISRRAVVEADPEVLEAIRKIVNLTVLEGDKAIDYAVNRIMEERFTRVAEDPIEKAIGKIAAKGYAGSEKRLQDYADTQVQAVEARSRKTTENLREFAQLKALDAKVSAKKDALEFARKESSVAEARAKAFAEKRFADLEKNIQVSLAETAKRQDLSVDEIKSYTANRLEAVKQKAQEDIVRVTAETALVMEDKLKTLAAKNLSDDQVRQIAEDAVLQADVQIRAIALQTLAESDNYIKTIAKEAVREDDPQMQEALRAAAKQVILGKDKKVEFAIRSMLKTAPAAGYEDGILPPPDVEGENLETAAQLKPVTPRKNAQPNEDDTLALQQSGHRNKWIDVRNYQVVVHEDSLTLDKLLKRTLKRAEPFVGPWKVKWKVSEKNADILLEEFSLDAETTFEVFINYLSQYILNYRGIKLTFSMFDKERILVISD